jgi:hypothetical protein
MIRAVDSVKKKKKKAVASEQEKKKLFLRNRKGPEPSMDKKRGDCVL